VSIASEGVSRFETNGWFDNSSRVIAAFNGEKGGTKNTIDYALKKKVPVYNILNE